MEGGGGSRPPAAKLALPVGLHAAPRAVTAPLTLANVSQTLYMYSFTHLILTQRMSSCIKTPL